MLDRTTQNIANGIKLSVVDLPKSLKPKLDRKSSIMKDKKDPPGKLQTSSYVTMFAAECIGTGLLMFLGCMGGVTEVDTPKPSHHMGSLSFGLVILLIIQLFGHISGAHLNPAVTLATVIFQILTPMMGVVYVVAQFVGAVIGFALLKVLIPLDYTSNGFCVTKPHELINTMQALAIETIITTVLIFICCAVWDKRNEEKQESVPLRFGFVIVAISMVAGPFTGASMNTARSLAPVLFDGNWTDQWIYLVGPNVGAVLGCGIYKCLFSLKEDKEEDNKEEQIYLEEVGQNGSDKV